MTYITIGEFAQRTRLSPKALRLYGELGLVVPARVDPDSVYRLYREEFFRDAFASLRAAEIAPAPQAVSDCLFDAGPMLWQEVDRPGASRAFVVAGPGGLRAEHWFELEPVDGGTLVSHTVEGETLGESEAVWTERIEPLHDRLLEALLDNVEANVASDEPRAGRRSVDRRGMRRGSSVS